MRQKRKTAAALALALALTCPALAAEPQSEVETAASYLKEQGIYRGNESGDLMLDKGLTRAELATLLARLDDPNGEFAAYPQGFAYLCMFADVPDWAKSPVGYAWNRGLVKGYDTGRYGAADMVTPDAACTVILRLYGHKADEGDAWNYATAADFAVGLGWIGQSTARETEITRGDMAVLICRAMGQGEVESETPISEPTEDYSQQANAAIFSDSFTRETYNAIRQTILDAQSGLTGGEGYRMELTPEGKVTADQVVTAFGSWPLYEIRSTASGQYSCQAKYPSGYQEAANYCGEFIDGLAGLSEVEKVRRIAFFVCDHLDYDMDSTSTPRTALTSEKVSLGNCQSFAHNFLFLCDMADIPCMFVHSEIHQWNLVYVDGQWYMIDVSNLDAWEVSARGYASVIHEESYPQGEIYQQTDPQLTRIVKELLVPGSSR